MHATPGLAFTLANFLVVLTVLVFIHELGHYLVARRNGVKIDIFSIGFGPELFGWHDRAGTRWRISAIPLGGYVKFFGDMNAASTAHGSVASMSAEDRAKSFHAKPLGQRAAVVAAGPIFNFLFAWMLLTGLFAIAGQPYTPSVVGDVMPGTAAEAAGLQVGDRITGIADAKVSRFEDIQRLVALYPERHLPVDLVRDGQTMRLWVQPRMSVIRDRFGDEHRLGRLGISHSGMDMVKRDPAGAAWHAGIEMVTMVDMTLRSMGQMITGERSADELSGPVKIAQLSGRTAADGLVSLVWFMAVLSLNLGLINLFPIPMLDGGHLLFYGFEALRGRPLAAQVQEYGFRIGLALVLSLMLFATWNDIQSLPVAHFLSRLFS